MDLTKMNQVKKKLLVTSLAAISVASSFGLAADTYTLSNASSTQTTADIYNWIAHLPNRNTNSLLSGAFGGYANVSDSNGFSSSESDNINALASQRPGIYACDYARGWDVTAAGSESDLINYSCNSQLISHWQSGGLVQISNHLPNPIFEGNIAYYNDSGKAVGGLNSTVSNDDLAKLLVDQSAERIRWLAILDKVAEGLQELEDAGVSVIYRPLHEMNGEWFWWGATSYNSSDQTRQQLYVELYKDMFDYFTNTKALDNLIWVYSPDAKRDAKTAFYPGSAYVDIVGLDAYLDDFSLMNGYCEMLTLNKPFALAEVGPDQNKGQFNYHEMVKVIKSHFPQTSYFIPWNGVWSPTNNLKTSEAFNHDAVVNLGEIWEGGHLSSIVETAPFQTEVFYDFESGTEGWGSESQSVSGYWAVNEWACSGGQSLKANIELKNDDTFDLKVASALDLSDKSSLSVLVRLASWGNVGSGLKAKLYLKTGPEYQWFDGGELTITNGQTNTAILDLNTVANRNDIRELGIYFSTGSASGSTALYIDKVLAY